MPQACTLIRTLPGPGSGIGRSTISKGPFGRETCATRIPAMARSSGEMWGWAAWPFPSSYAGDRARQRTSRRSVGFRRFPWLRGTPALSQRGSPFRGADHDPRLRPARRELDLGEVRVDLDLDGLNGLDLPAVGEGIIHLLPRHPPRALRSRLLVAETHQEQPAAGHD